MDSNTFAILVLALGTVIISVTIWQIFSVARARTHSRATADRQDLAHQLDDRLRHLDQRLTALADDIHELDRRVAKLDQPHRP